MKFFGELLIFVLLFVTNIRVFFVDTAKRDPLAAVAPMTFILSILQIAAWGVGFFTALGLIISFLVLLSNFHAMFRYSERLYVDHYSPLMMVWAIFTSILSLAAIVLLIIFAPIELSNRKLGIKETTTKYSGDFTSGFEYEHNFHKINAILTEYKIDQDKINLEKEKEKKANEKKSGKKKSNDSVSSESFINKELEKSNCEDNCTKDIVLFVPDKRGDTYFYEPFLQLLAKKGYTVVSTDFYTRDGKWFHSILDLKILRRVAMVTSSLTDNQKFNSQREYYTFNITKECKALLKMLREKYGEDCRIFVISDGMSNEAVRDLEKTKQKNVTGTLALDTIPGYETSGYGCIAQTSPLLNKIMGQPKERKLETPTLLAEQVAASIKF